MSLFGCNHKTAIQNLQAEIKNLEFTASAVIAKLQNTMKDNARLVAEVERMTEIVKRLSMPEVKK